MSRFSGLIKINILHIFIGIASIFGLIFVFITPPFQAPDEQVHFYKAYAVSEGQFLCSSEGEGYAGSYLPANISEFVNSTAMTSTTRTFNTLENAFNYYPANEKVFFEHYSSCVYTPLPYVPQAIGIFIGEILNLSFMSIFYLARLMNLVVYIIICAFSIRLVPRLKNLVALLALLPMSLHQAGSLSADALTNSISFLLICYILYVKYKEGWSVDRKNLIVIAGLSIVIGLLKITYFPLSLAVFLIPHTKYKSIKDYLFKSSLIVFLATAFTAIWIIVTKSMNIFVPVDTVAQLSNILHHPLSYGRLMLNNITNYDNLYLQFIGILGWLSVPLPMIIYLTYFVALFIVAFVEGVRQKEYTAGRISSSIISMFIFVICYILIETSLYLNWPQTSNVIVEGVQGRYFIPIVLLFFYFVYLLAPTLIKYSKLAISIILVVTLFNASLRMIDHYYFFGPRYKLLELDNNHFIEGGILADTNLRQSFIADENKLKGLSIYISTFQKEITTPYIFELRDGNDSSLIREVHLNSSEIGDNAYFDISFESIMNSKGKKYLISIFPAEQQVSDPITFQLSKPNIYTDGDLFIKGIKYEEDIVFRLLY